MSEVLLVTAVELHLLSTQRARIIASMTMIPSMWMVVYGDQILRPLYCLLPVLLISTVTDLWRRVIPNWLTCMTFCSVIVLAAVHSITGVSTGVPCLLDSLLGAGVSGGLLLLVSRGRAGGGDVKLAGVLGSVLGPIAALQVLLVTCVLAVAFVSVSILRIPVQIFMYGDELPRMSSGSTTPMAGFFLLATLIFFLGAVQ